MSQHMLLLARAHVPHAGGIDPDREQPLPIGREHHRVDATFMAAQRAHLGPTRPVPQLDEPFVAADGQQLAVRRESDGARDLAVTAVGRPELPLDAVVHLGLAR